MRAVAVLGVVVYHLKGSWLPGGFAGVDVFFVLSGYFITGLLLREIDRTARVDLLAFWGRRARRLLPASILVILVTVVAGYQMTNALEAHRIARDGLLATVFGMNWQAAHQGTVYLQEPNPSPLVHYWSLGVEEQFYAAWPLLLLALAFIARRVRPLTVRRTLTAAAVVAGVLSFALALQQTKPENSFAYFGTTERVWQLALGGLVAVLATRLEAVPQLVRDVGRWVGLALIAWFFVTISLSVVYPGRKSLVPAVGAALIIAAGQSTRRWDPLTRLLSSPPAQLGGRYSYSWYLWHYPPLVLLPIALDRALHTGELIACAAATLLLAVATYHLIENPIRAAKPLAVRRGGRSLVLGALLLVLGVGVTQVTAAAAERNVADARIADRYGHVLNPQPADAAAERPQPYSNGCFTPYTDGLAKECRYLPDTGHGDVIVVGDSHAGAWFPATLQMAKKHGWGYRFWARDSCPFADVTKSVRGMVYTKCDTWRADVMRRLIAAKPSLVIIASLDSALPPLYTRTAAGEPTSTMVKGTAARQLWEDGYARNLATLKRAGIRSLVIHDNPGYPATLSAPDCVLSHADDLDKCSLPQQEASPSGPGDLGAARRVGGVSTVDFTRSFCRGQRCYQVIGSTLAYRDNNHLTPQMISRLAPTLDAAAVATMQGKVVAGRT